MPIILQKETNFLKKEPEVLKKLIKLAGEGGVADKTRREEDGVADNFTEVEEPGVESPVDGGQGYTWSPVDGGQGYT